MLRSTELGKIAGIDVRIHWTFWLLMIFYVLTTTLSSGLVSGIMVGLTFALVFVCVLAHEFGHALTARAFGIPTHDITLLPVGGLARLARMPEKPMQELIIALAGPAVNVAIALVLLPFLSLGQLVALSNDPVLVLGDSLLQNIFVANVVLVLFNMLPAFPMDGGRVLRSLIAMFSSHLRATEIAVRLGRLMALGFVIFGLYYQSLSLVLVGVFVFLAGTGELFEARRRAMASRGEPWFQFVWTNGPSHAAWPGQSPWPADSTRAEVIDATDVRRLQ